MKEEKNIIIKENLPYEKSIPDIIHKEDMNIGG